MRIATNNNDADQFTQHRRAPFESSFHAWMQGLSSGLSIAGDVNQLLDGILRSNPAHEEALSLNIDALMARQQARAAESRVRELEAELAKMRELISEDQLTGSLNRRGLDNALEREMARAARNHSPLCVALLDLDDFKKLNDTHGHCAGDAALVHLVQVVKDTLRKMDVIARFGGEEFMILLPDTPLDKGVQTLCRVQDELAQRVLMHNGEHLSMRFSAGVTLCNAGENQADLIERADHALYRAKKAGKNRVVPA
ncbi:MAG TPA: GGDEF domain-containing protein [Noviherbaspirillum sp.]|nr:GGDEF domain-containing protein [Noviherbaspirillum sp.]